MIGTHISYSALILLCNKLDQYLEHALIIRRELDEEGDYFVLVEPEALTCFFLIQKLDHRKIEFLY